MDTLRYRARELRNHSTDAERVLWRALRGRQLDGFRFRRQVPLAGYVADFVCPQARLIVEVDGGQHAERAEYDLQRTAELEKRGYRVLRYWNDDVLLRLQDVVADIHRQLVEGARSESWSARARAEEGEGEGEGEEQRHPSPALPFAARKGGGTTAARAITRATTATTTATTTAATATEQQQQSSNTGNSSDNAADACKGERE